MTFLFPSALYEVGDYNGWTGYTWNHDLFPEPDAFLGWLHEMGLKTVLNLHPALGIRPYETQYPALAQRLSIDPAGRETIKTDEDNLLSRRDRTQEKCMAILHAFKLETQAKMGISQQLAELQTDPAILKTYASILAPSQIRALLEVTCQAGVHHIRNTRNTRNPHLLILWNNHEDGRLHYQFNRYDDGRFGLE
ncbi:MAG: hypothetical protein GY796_26820 [Chloroflexi bacterium]|nr:hypothetical protein [Chloroflexota bacterium]